MEILEPGYFYYIYNHANGNENLFKCDDNYHYFLKKFKQYIFPIADTFAYCLMPNHIHFLVRVKEEYSLSESFPKFETLEKVKKSYFISKQFANLFSSYTQSFNKMHQRNGSLFLKNFKRIRINTEQYLKQAIVYIHLNPVNHEFVDVLDKWKYSSYKSILSSKSSSVKRDEVIELFNDKQNYIDYHRIKNSELYASKMNVEY